MKNNRLTIFAIGAAVCIALLWYLGASGARKRFSWFENYRAENDQPYGAIFIRKMLESYRSGENFTLNRRDPIRNVLKEVEYPDRTDYIFIGQDIYLDSESTYALARFLEDGGNVFIASLTAPSQILNSAYFQECSVPLEFEHHRAKSVGMNFYHDKLRTKEPVTFNYRFVENDFPYQWGYVSEKVFCDSTRSVVPLGYQDSGRINFVKVAVGKGSLYLHSNPLVFTNYSLTDKKKMEYASGVFSHLDGKDIIWDEFSKIPLPGSGMSKGPLYFLLEQPGLKYAWWLLLLTVIIYVLFAAKRKQRVVPVREPKTNTSLEYVNMIARLHFMNGNHLDMAHKKMKYFLYFVRSKYGIQSEKFNDDSIRRLAEKSSVNYDEVQAIFSRYYLIEERFRNNIEASRLVDLYDSIDNFYKKSK